MVVYFEVLFLNLVIKCHMCRVSMYVCTNFSLPICSSKYPLIKACFEGNAVRVNDYISMGEDPGATVSAFLVDP